MLFNFVAMLFNSLVFLYAFLPATYMVFWRLKRKNDRYLWLTLTGYVFYAGAERNFAWLANRLALQGHRLLVVLLPWKHSVYAPLLAEPDPGPEASLASLAELERRLRARGIPVVNLTAPLRDAARAALERGELIYWRDDTRWNAAGNAVAARAIAPALTRLR